MRCECNCFHSKSSKPSCFLSIQLHSLLFYCALCPGDELRKKIETEESEIERLKQEIQELQYLRHDSDLEDMSSASDSSIESEDEEDMNDMLSALIQENLQLEVRYKRKGERGMLMLKVKLSAFVHANLLLVCVYLCMHVYCGHCLLFTCRKLFI